MNSQKEYNILVVDDELEVANILVKYLGFYKGFKNIVVAKDGVQAMHKLSNQEFDLIITDIVMPKRDGLSLIEHLRKIPKYYHTKIMIVSGCLNKDLVMMAMRKGIRQVLVKPFTPRQLLEKTFEVLKIGSNSKKEVARILKIIAKQVAQDLGNEGEGLSENEVGQLIDAYKASKVK